MKICLHMIVRNEAAVIRRCLDSVRPWIDHWIISDTGSTDGTQDIVRDAMRGVPGELIERPWVDFATNRTEAMALAREAMQGEPGAYLMTIDADEIFTPDPGWTWPALTADTHEVEVRIGDISFTRALLTRASTPWYYHGVVHEDIRAPGRPSYGCVLPGAYVESTREGARSKAPDKYARDAEVLLREHHRDPSDARTVFYLAQSYRDGGDFGEALKWYTLRANMKGWDQETWHAALDRAKCKEILKHAPQEVIEAYLCAYSYRPRRPESLWHLARYMQTIGQPDVAAIFEAAARLKPPSGDVMFIDRPAYGGHGGVDVRVAMTTCKREGFSTLQSSLSSCIVADPTVASGELRVFAEGDIGALPAAIAVDHYDPARSLSNPLARMLAWGASGKGLVVTLEDDVLFSRDWLCKASRLLAVARHAVGPCVVSLHDMYTREQLAERYVHTDLTFEGVRLWQASQRAAPNGSQGMIMTAETAANLSAFIQSVRPAPTKMDKGHAWGFDVDTLQACREFKLPFFVCDPCLLMHQHAVASTWWPDRETDPAWRGVSTTKRWRPW